MSTHRQGEARRRGAATVETAFVLMLFILFLFAVFEYGRLLMVRHLLDNAAREGARQAVVATAGADTEIQAIVTKFLAGQQQATITIYKVNPTTGTNLGAWADAAFGESIAVQVDGTYHPILPTFGLLPDGFAVRGKSIMRCEAN
jgi:Flp pilus assembly protein TadG